jgi:HSP20 family protein
MSKIKNLFGRSKNQADLIDEQPAPDDFSELEQATKPVATTTEQEWLDEDVDGQLSIDVYQDKNNIIIKSTIAGVRPEDIDISIQNDLITIKGKRENDLAISQEDYFYQECYWGSFSRSIILPVEVKSEETKAELKNGILTVVLPKAKPIKAVSIKVKTE